MSNLAQELLKKVGFKIDSVRGPSHWVTAKNMSIKDLWHQLMDKQAKNDSQTQSSSAQPYCAHAGSSIIFCRSAERS
ncbi:MAG: hypothetical protein AAB134_05730 [Pseudomonadota bacterium]